MLGKRASFPEAEVLGKSAAICKKAIELPEIKSAACVGIYISMGNEVNAELLFDSLISSGKKVFLPVVAGNGLKFAGANSLSGLAKGKYGALEPKGKKFAEKGEIGVFLVPGAAFDLQGNRIGRGKGFYDKFFSKEEGFRIGLAYDFQVVPQIAAQEHDIKMDAVVTESRVLRFWPVCAFP